MSEQECKTRKRKANVKPDDLENQSDDEKKQKKPAPRSALKISMQVIGAVLSLSLLYVVIVPCPIDPVPVITPGSLPYFEGVMEENNLLEGIVKIGEGKLQGPESIQVDRNGDVYTGLHDGRIVKILKSGEIKELARTGENHKNCGEDTMEHICGRPLGIQLDKKEENLFICDGYFGLMSLNLASERLTTLVPASKGIKNVPFKFLNHLTVASNGKIYFTDSSWRWDRKFYAYMLLEGGGKGRVLSYDTKTGETELLLSGLFFPNGITLSPDEDFLLICETASSRILRLFISGSQKGIYDVFQDNLPGFPDNIRTSLEGGYWVALPGIRKWPFSFLDIVGPYPKIKSLIAKLVPNVHIDGFLKPYGLFIKIDEYGDIIKSYHDPSGATIGFISEVFEDKGVLYLGSFKNNFMGKFRI